MSTGMILTDAGREMLALALAGKELCFTRGAVGDGSLVYGDEPKSFTALKNERKSLSIQALRTNTTGTCECVLSISNEGGEMGFWLREFGLFAKHPDTEQELLYSYCNKGDDSGYLEGYDGSNPITFTLTLFTVIDQAENITAIINTNTWEETKQKVEELIIQADRATATSEQTAESLGDLEDLETDDKASAVNAINELKGETKSLFLYVKPLRDAATLMQRKTQVRGQCIGTHPTAKQISEMYNYTYDDIYLGDYWEDTVTYTSYDGSSITRKLRWRIVHFTYNINSRTGCVVVWLSNDYLYQIPFWDTNSKGKGFLGSYLYLNGMNAADQVAKDFFDVNSGGNTILYPAAWHTPTAAVPGEDWYYVKYTSGDANHVCMVPMAAHFGMQDHPLVLCRCKAQGSSYYTNTTNFNDTYLGMWYIWDWFRFSSPILDANSYKGLNSKRTGFWLVDPSPGGKYQPYYSGWGVLGFTTTGAATTPEGNTIGLAPYVRICHGEKGSLNI